MSNIDITKLQTHRLYSIKQGALRSINNLKACIEARFLTENENERYQEEDRQHFIIALSQVLENTHKNFTEPYLNELRETALSYPCIQQLAEEYQVDLGGNNNNDIDNNDGE